MIEILPQTAGDLLAMALSGMVSESDLDTAFDDLHDRVDLDRVRRILLDWQRLEGWEPGAKTVATWFGLHNWATVLRVAIIADVKWDDERLRIADIFKMADVRRFRSGDGGEALAWLD